MRVSCAELSPDRVIRYDPSFGQHRGLASDVDVRWENCLSCRCFLRKSLRNWLIEPRRRPATLPSYSSHRKTTAATDSAPPGFGFGKTFVRRCGRVVRVKDSSELDVAKIRRQRRLLGLLHNIRKILPTSDLFTIQG